MTRYASIVLGAALLGGCSVDHDFLFAAANPDFPGIQDLGTIVPADATGMADDPTLLQQSVRYGAVGSTGDSSLGGITFDFEGTGGSVCVFVDPEAASWNQAVGKRNPVVAYSWPDNVRDDGDQDLYAGFALYYTGSPGVSVGDFEIQYEDSLGNPVAIQLDECVIATDFVSEGGHSGRGAPEYCTLRATQPGVDYEVLVQTWSVPADDSVTSYGMTVVADTCDTVLATAETAECVIRDEAKSTDGASLDEADVLQGGDTLAGFSDFETAYCDTVANSTTALYDYCAGEQENGCDDSGHCFCGDASQANTNITE